MNFEYAKVFGERNTGTNFLNQLLKENTTLKVLEHGNNDACKKQAQDIYEKHRIKEKLAQKIILERLIDNEREKEFSHNFGWKHAAPSLQKIKTNKLYEKTLFICLIRNPWRFVTALHHRPYNLIPVPETDFSAFIRAPFLANSRDGLSDNFIKNPVELWNRKVSSYQELHNQTNGNVITIYYEAMILDIEKFIRSLSTHCEIKSEKIIVPHESTKGDNKNFEEYRAEAIAYAPLNFMSKDDALYIHQELDKSIIKETPYSQIYNSLKN